MTHVALMATTPAEGARLDRLTRSADITAVLRRGRSRSGDLLAVHVLRREAIEGGEGPAARTRCTVVASRRVGGAVRRNRAKRLLREAARTVAWQDGLDVVLVARAACAGSGAGAVGAELGRLARQLEAVDA